MMIIDVHNCKIIDVYARFFIWWWEQLCRISDSSPVFKI